MAILTITGEPGCRPEAVARRVAIRLGFEFVGQARLAELLAAEFGKAEGEPTLPAAVYASGLTVVLARLASQHHLVICSPGVETLARQFPAGLRVALSASARFQTGILMIEERLDRPAAAAMVKELKQAERLWRRQRFGRMDPLNEDFDLVVNAETSGGGEAEEIILVTAQLHRLAGQGFLTAAQEAALQFQARLKLARHGVSASGSAGLAQRRPFVNESEQVFAHLLNFYRIAWEYEPRSFPIQWDRDGRVLESFTPDFFLPELDLYVEITTMKQANVTRKNRKVKLLKTIYPQINIQVFYQRDFQNLIFKYGLAPVMAQA